MRSSEFLTEMPFVSDLNKGFEPVKLSEPLDHETDSNVPLGNVSLINMEKIANVIRRDCVPYLTNNKNNLASGYHLYRGIKGSDNRRDFFLKGNVRTDRKPRDTRSHWHNLMDRFFKNQFGYPYRSASMFAYTDPHQCVDYGPAYAVFPIGDYDICYSSIVEDFTTDVADHYDSPAINRVLRNISDADIKKLDYLFGFGWESVGDIREEFKSSCTNYEFSPEFEEFLLKYFMPRLRYEETYTILDVQHSEAMVKCGSYYGVLRKVDYKSAIEEDLVTLTKLLIS